MLNQEPEIAEEKEKAEQEGKTPEEITHEKRVAAGKKGASARWGKNYEEVRCIKQKNHFNLPLRFQRVVKKKRAPKESEQKVNQRKRYFRF